MAARNLTILLASALLATACSTAPASSAGGQQDIDFVRGCWVAKDAPGGQIHAFLRLLPPSPGDVVLDGEVRPVASLYADQARRFSFQRDGSSATLINLAAGTPEQTFTRDNAAADGARQAIFRSASVVMRVSGDDEGLKISTTNGDGSTETIHFAGERDGCD